MFIFLCTLFSSLHNPAAFVVEFYFSGSAGSIYQIYHQIWEEGVCLGRGRGVLEGIIGWGAISADTITQNLPLYSRVTACNTLRCIQVLAYGVGYPSYQCQCQCSIGSLQARLIVLTLLPKTYHYTRGSLHAIRCAASMDPLRYSFPDNWSLYKFLGNPQCQCHCKQGYDCWHYYPKLFIILVGHYTEYVVLHPPWRYSSHNNRSWYKQLGNPQCQCQCTFASHNLLIFFWSKS